MNRGNALDAKILVKLMIPNATNAGFVYFVAMLGVAINAPKLFAEIIVYVVKLVGAAKNVAHAGFV